MLGKFLIARIALYNILYFKHVISIDLYFIPIALATLIFILFKYKMNWQPGKTEFIVQLAIQLSYSDLNRFKIYFCKAFYSNSILYTGDIIIWTVKDSHSNYF